MVSAVIPSCILILVLFLEKRKGCLMMGGGDVKLMFVMALYFDWYRLLQVVFTACVAALLFAVSESLLPIVCWSLEAFIEIKFHNQKLPCVFKKYCEIF